VLAIVLAVVSLFFREDKLLAGVSAALGVSTIAMEISYIVIGALIVIAIIYAVMDHISLF